MADYESLRGTTTAHRRVDPPSAPDPAPPIRVRLWESRRGQDRLAQVLFLAPAVIYLVVFFGYPVVKNFLMALQKYSTSTFYTGEAPWAGLANYRAVLTSSVFSKALLNTVLF